MNNAKKDICDSLLKIVNFFMSMPLHHPSHWAKKLDVFSVRAGLKKALEFFAGMVPNFASSAMPLPNIPL